MYCSNLNCFFFTAGSRLHQLFWQPCLPPSPPPTVVRTLNHRIVYILQREEEGLHDHQQADGGKGRR